MYKVSIVVPVYNVKKYLCRCLDTIVEQTLQDIEVILVDDGSTDGSESICDEYSKKYPEKVKVIHQKNQGLGPARNTGIASAQGKYIGFVDSDDWISFDMYEKLYDFAEMNGCDVVLSDYYYIDVEKSTITKVNSYSSQKALTYIAPSDALLNNVSCYSWNKLYLKELIEDKCFPAKLFEDIPVLTKVICECRKMGYLPTPLYFYERKEGTLSTSIDGIRMLDTIDIENMALNSVGEEYRPILYYIFAKRFLQNIKSERVVFKADLIEHIKSHKAEIESNELIKADKDTKGVLKYLSFSTIPRRIVTAKFGKQTYTSKELGIIENWKKYTREFEYVFLNEDNCDIESAPKLVKEMYFHERFSEVENYYKAKYIYDVGGIALSTNIEFVSPMGDIRTGNGFFGYKNRNELLSDIWGITEKHDIICDLLNLYEHTDYDDSVSFSSFLLDTLLRHGLTNTGWTQNIEKGIRVYKFDVLAYDMCAGRSVSKIRPEIISDSSKYEIIERSALEFMSLDFFGQVKQKQALSKKVEEIDIIKNKYNLACQENIQLQKQISLANATIASYENSMCWKITKPLRFFLDNLRKIFRYHH